MIKVETMSVHANLTNLDPLARPVSGLTGEAGVVD
jgi:hypothetical protein